jgi:uncharacterized membrane protein YfcA
MAGAFVGGRLSALIPSSFLVLVFVSVMVAGALATLRRQGGKATALRATLRSTPRPRAGAPVRHARLLLIGTGVGGLAGLVGTGGGFLIVPVLLMLGLPVSQAVGTSLAVISLQSFAGFVAHAGQPVQFHWPILLGATAAAVAGSALGHRALSRVPADLVRKGFAFLVLFIAAAMLLREVPQSIEAGSNPALPGQGKGITPHPGPLPVPGGGITAASQSPGA